MERLERVRLGRRLRGLHRAKLAPPCASVPQQHDGARTPVPALSDIGALRLLTHRVQVKLLQRGLELFVLSEEQRATERWVQVCINRSGAGMYV